MQVLLAPLVLLTEVVSLLLKCNSIDSSIRLTDEVLLTPFRTQNVPPPMSSYQLKTSLSISSAETTPTQTPAHIALSPSGDLLASMWQNGRISVWSLNTRIGPGKGKAMDPALIWTAGVCDEEKVWRQLSVSELTEGEIRTVKVVMLGSEGGSDYLATYEISFVNSNGDKPAKEDSFLIKMPGANGRLVAGHLYLSPHWQDINGEIFEGWIALTFVFIF